jgi:hypothetical protein
MSIRLNQTGQQCKDGVLLSFSGINLDYNDNYLIRFDCVSKVPASASVRIDPTGYYFKPSEKNITLETYFSSYTPFNLDFSTTNVIKLSIINSSNVEVHRDYISLICGSLCEESGIIQNSSTPTVTPTNSPTPTVTPNITASPTVTPTLTPSVTSSQLINFRISFDNEVNNLTDCRQSVIRVGIWGVPGQRYEYSFGSNMREPRFELAITSGNLTLQTSPTYLFNTISINKPCEYNSIVATLTDGRNTVQDIGVFKCGQGCNN